MPTPTQLKAMISATARDLHEERLVAQAACIAQDVFPVWMDHLPARDEDGRRVSMEMVDRADVYIGIYALRYGWVPDFENPRQVSITELEFDRAMERKRSGHLTEVLIFILDDSVPVSQGNIEFGDVARAKLNAFKERASKRRVVGYYKSYEELQRRISEALADLKRRLQPGSPSISGSSPRHSPAAFLAKPDYIPRYKFIGRKDQLGVLSNWAGDDDSTVLLFRAIGGNGKSALTWHWAKDESEAFATRCRPPESPWAGRFWYSFYERGANMTDFCRQALAYMTGESKVELDKRPFAKLQEELLSQLQSQPWLMILDGMERVLVHYHQLDPSADSDEAADNPTDHMLNKRAPTDAIRDEDNDLLRTLVGAVPSKILISTRLLPRVLLNDSGAGIPGVRPLDLPGLNDADAEAFLRSCGDVGSEIKGDPIAIRSYLRENCDNHPLTIGALGGLIVGYRKEPGNFTKWLADPNAGGALDFGSLRLEQRRNHILKAALDDLPMAGRELLSILALLYGSVDYATIEALNPHLPSRPESASRPPAPPEASDDWEFASDAVKAELKKSYTRQLANWENLPATKDWRINCRAAESELDATLTDLTRNRGLLQYDGRTHRYELHPVVRSVVTHSLNGDDRKNAGQRILDHFNALSHDPYENASCLTDLEVGLHIVRTLLKLGRFEEAADSYLGVLCMPLLRLEEYAQVIAITRPFFPSDWATHPRGIDVRQVSHFLGDAAIAIGHLHGDEAAIEIHVATLRLELLEEDLSGAGSTIRWLADSDAGKGNKLARENRLLQYASTIAELLGDRDLKFRAALDRAMLLSEIGETDEADRQWEVLRNSEPPMGHHKLMKVNIESNYANHSRNKGCLSNELLDKVERMAQKANYRLILREVCWLRGLLSLEKQEWTAAVEWLRQCLEMAHSSRLPDPRAETALAFAKLNVEPTSVARADAERLERLSDPDRYHLALIWRVLGDLGKAHHNAIAAYEAAWADGEPFVHRLALTKAEQLLKLLNLPTPILAPYDASKDEPFDWEADICAAIEKRRAREAEEASDGEPRFH